MLQMGLCVILAFHVANLKYFISQIRNISEGVFKYSISQIKNISHASIYSRVLTFKWDTNDNIQLEHTQAHQSIKCAIAKISHLTNQKYFLRKTILVLCWKVAKKWETFFGTRPLKGLPLLSYGCCTSYWNCGGYKPWKQYKDILRGFYNLFS